MHGIHTDDANGGVLAGAKCDTSIWNAQSNGSMVKCACFTEQCTIISTFNDKGIYGNNHRNTDDNTPPKSLLCQSNNAGNTTVNDLRSGPAVEDDGDNGAPNCENVAATGDGSGGVVVVAVS